MAGMESNTTNLTRFNNPGTQHLANGLGRREFIRVTGITVFGLGLNGCLATPASAAAETKAATISREDIIAGLEIGTSKVCAAVARRLPDGTIKLLGIGQAPSFDVTRQSIVHSDVPGACLRAALADAEGESNVKIRSVVLAVTGMKIAPYGSGLTWERIFECEEVCYADRGDGELRRVGIEKCKRVPGLRVVWGAGTRIENSIRCLKRLGIEVERIVFAPVASAEALLPANRKKLGALVIDMGEGTTDYAVYAGGELVQSDSLPIGGEHIASDLSRELRIPWACAEKLVIEEGSVRLGPSLPREFRPIVLWPKPGFSGRIIEREVFNTIIHQTVREAFELVKFRLVDSGVRLDSLRAGVRLTGGCSMLPGICELANDFFGLWGARRTYLNLEGTSAFPGGSAAQRFTCALGLLKLRGAG